MREVQGVWALPGLVVRLLWETVGYKNQHKDREREENV